MIIVLDTNIWLKELVLNSSSGSALRFFLNHHSARLAVPEVVRLEVQINLRKTIEEAVKNIENGNRKLLTLFGSMEEVILPTETEINNLILGIFSGLNIEIIDVPFTLESARSSFLKTIEKVAPSHNNQQFKDGVLWANCLELLEQDTVIFATEDRAFYLNSDPDKGLAKNLLAEVSEKPHKLRLVRSVSDILEHVESDIPVDEKWLISVIQEQAHTGTLIEGLLSVGGAKRSTGEEQIQYELFATENPKLLYFKYAIEIPCINLDSSDQKIKRLFLKGNGNLRPGISPELETVKVEEERLEFTNSDGSVNHVKNNYGPVDIIGGRTIIEHSIRYPLKKP
jgi:hypothetical protein